MYRRINNFSIYNNPAYNNDTDSENEMKGYFSGQYPVVNYPPYRFPFSYGYPIPAYPMQSNFSAAQDLELLGIVGKMHTNNSSFISINELISIIDWKAVSLLMKDDFTEFDCQQRWVYLANAHNSMQLFAYSGYSGYHYMPSMPQLAESNAGVIGVCQDQVTRKRGANDMPNDGIQPMKIPMISREEIKIPNVNREVEIVSSSTASNVNYSKPVLKKEPAPLGDNEVLTSTRGMKVSSESASDKSLKMGIWSVAEDRKLINILKDIALKSDIEGFSNMTEIDQIREIYDNQKFNWNTVSSRMGMSRSAIQCRNRWQLTLGPNILGVRHGAWEPEEDNRLINEVYNFQKKNGNDVNLLGEYGATPSGIGWIEIARKVGTRTAIQCRNRWNQGIQPKIKGLKIGGWTNEEDKILAQAVKTYDGSGRGGGVDWKKVAQCLVNRTPKHCVNRYNNHVRNKVETGVYEEYNLLNPKPK